MSKRDSVAKSKRRRQESRSLDRDSSSSYSDSELMHKLLPKVDVNVAREQKPKTRKPSGIPAVAADGKQSITSAGASRS